MKYLSYNFLGVFLGLFLIAATSAQAQGIRDMMAACQGDYERYCSDVRPGAGRIVSCLADHKPKLTRSCRLTIEDGQRVLRRISSKIGIVRDTLEACVADLDKYCSHVAPVGGKKIVCLARREAKLRPLCRNYVKKAKARVRNFYAE